MMAIGRLLALPWRRAGGRSGSSCEMMDKLHVQKALRERKGIDAVRDDRLAKIALLDAGTLARLLSVSVRTLWRMESRHEIPPAVRVNGRVVRWRFSDIERFIRGLKT